MSSSKQKNLRCALSMPSVPEICKAINTALEQKYSYCCLPLVHPRFKRDHLNKSLKHWNLPLTRSDLLLTADCWQSYVVGYMSKFYNCDSSDASIRKNAVEGFIEELKFTSHLTLTALIVPIRSGRIENFCRILNNFLINRQIMFNVLISIPLELNDKDVEIGSETCEVSASTTWHWWKKVRSLCESSSKLGVVLEVTSNISLTNDEIDRWLSEPIKCLKLSTSLFLTNKHGFPVLSKAHQKFVCKFFKLDIDVIIEGANRHKDKGMAKYAEYMNYLYKNYQQTNGDTMSKFTKGYEDCLQNPLQPLMDNLESQVYEIFEKDPIKYSQYQKAIAAALVDRVSENDKLTLETVIMVVGAGRGPLVKAALQAAADTERKIKLFAIDKNPHAINTLLNLKNDEWGDKVTVISTDMREWKFTEKADILVSELLGSFGDNELSPECLDGAQSFLKKDGISIPYRYRSFIAPIQSYKIYSEVKRCKEYDHPHEAPYVVLFHNHCRIAEEKVLFEFVHPNKQEKIDNNRYEAIEFRAKFDATMHGIGGYFDSHLYKDIDISITPSTHSPGMFSWFPMFFPLSDPIEVKTGDSIIIHFWRHCTSKQVHYEWSCSSPNVSIIHNPNGRTYYIGL